MLQVEPGKKSAPARKTSAKSQDSEENLSYENSMRVVKIKTPPVSVRSGVLNGKKLEHNPAIRDEANYPLASLPWKRQGANYSAPAWVVDPHATLGFCGRSEH